jgi:hypothetical protein
MATSARPSQNHLLGALPPAEAQRWIPFLESVDLPLGHVLYESGGGAKRRKGSSAEGADHEG